MRQKSILRFCRLKNCIFYIFEKKLNIPPWIIFKRSKYGHSLYSPAAISDDNQKQILSQFINIFNTIFIKGLFGEGKSEGGKSSRQNFLKKSI